MSLRILHVIQTVSPKSGGPIEGLCQQAKSHLFYGHSVEIACLDKPEDNFLDIPYIKVHPCRSTWLDNLIPVTLYAWLKSNILSYDCVIVNCIWGLHLFVAWSVSANKNVPFFVFIHGMLDPWFKFRYPLKHVKKWLFWPWAVYPCLRDADAVFFTCEQEKLLARKSFWLYDCNETVINYGTAGIPNPKNDYATSFLENHPTLINKRIFLFLGRVHPKKGPDLLIKSLAILQEKGQWDTSNMRLVFAGPHDSLYSSKLVSISKKLGLFNSIYWTGMLSGDQKWGAFQCAEAFVLASHQENFGIAVVEALSCGVPVLITPNINIANEIKYDQAGLVEPDNLQGATQLFLRWLALSTRDKLKMKKAARQCFEKRFHSSLTSTSITKHIYQALLERSLQ